VYREEDLEGGPGRRGRSATGRKVSPLAVKLAAGILSLAGKGTAYVSTEVAQEGQKHMQAYLDSEKLGALSCGVCAHCKGDYTKGPCPLSGGCIRVQLKQMANSGHLGARMHLKGFEMIGMCLKVRAPLRNNTTTCTVSHEQDCAKLRQC